MKNLLIPIFAFSALSSAAQTTVTVEAHIHTPLLHSLVVYDVRCPLHALHGVAFLLPSVSVEVAELNGLARMVLDGCHGVCGVSVRVVDERATQIAEEAVGGSGVALVCLKYCPLLIILSGSGLASAKVRSIYIICRGCGICDVVNDDGRTPTSPLPQAKPPCPSDIM